MKNKIYLKHWMALKPQNYSGNTDLYYLKIANKIYSNLIPSAHIQLSQFLSKDDLALFCCYLVCYFEDVISKIHIWSTFKSLHKELYNKELPFYTIEEDYIADEINFEDVAFLTWYFINTIQENKFVSPFSDFIMDIASTTIKVFDDEYEYAPENKKLQKLFKFDDKNPNLYTTRAFLQLVYFESYLFNTDIKFRFDHDILDSVEENKDEETGIILSYTREIAEDFTFNKASALLALTAKDWVSSLIGKSHSQYKNITNISKKVNGLFLYKGQSPELVILEHIASGMSFEMTKKSFDHYESLVEDDIIYIGLVKWQDEWWFSGNFSVSDFDADLILDLKNSIEARNQVSFLNELNQREEIVKLQKEAFLKFNNGSPIAFLLSKDIPAFTTKFIDFYINELNISEKEHNEAKQRAKDDGYFVNEIEVEDFDTEEETIVFFNPKSGLEFYFGILNAFPDKNNPFFSQESHEDIMHLLISQNISTELVLYFVNTYKNKLSFFQQEPNKSYLNDLDFLLRLWKKENYHTKPQITITGKKEIS